MHPTAIEAAYQKDMRAYVREIRRLTALHLIPEIPAMRAEAEEFRPDAAGDEPEAVPGLLSLATTAGTWYARLLRARDAMLGGMEDATRKLWDLARRHGKQTADFNSRQFHLSIRAAISVDLFKSEPWLVGELKAFEIENLRLIKSIPQGHVEKLQGVIVKALREGQSTATIIEAVRGVSDVTEARAELIAIDQVSTLNAQLTKQRQIGIGVKQAIWRGVLDRRERPTHVALEGKVFSWAKPPLGGPGAEIRCRCWAEAVFPELKDVDAMVIAP